MILTVMMEGISKAATVLPVLMNTIPCHDRGHINVMLVLQNCSDSLRILPSTSSDTNAASSDCAYHIGSMEVEEDMDMQGEEVEVNVKTEKGIGSEEEECISVKDEEGIYVGEEEEEEEDVESKVEVVEDIVIKEEEDMGIKEEVSLECTV